MALAIHEMREHCRQTREIGAAMRLDGVEDPVRVIRIEHDERGTRQQAREERAQTRGVHHRHEEGDNVACLNVKAHQTRCDAGERCLTVRHELRLPCAAGGREK